MPASRARTTEPVNTVIEFLDQKAKFLILAFFAVCLWIAWKTFQDYGITWDEQYHQIYGNLILEWYFSLFKDSAPIHHLFLVFYGGFFDTLVQIFSYLLPWDNIETRHFLGSLFGLWTVFMSYKIAKHIAGEFAGFCSAVFLILHPVFYGHMFNNPVDVPFAALFSTAFYFIISSYDNLPRISRRNLFEIGISIGLALAIRIGGILVLVPCLIARWFLWFSGNWQENKNRLGPIILDWLRNLAGILVIAWAVMLVWWPRAQIDPLLYPIKALAQMARWDFNPEDLYIFFGGIYYKISEVPKSYLWKSIALSLPEFFFVALGLGSMLAVRATSKQSAKRNKIVLIIFAVIYPVLAAFVLNTPRFDGFRHFLFLIPLLAVLAGISFAEFLRSKAVKILKAAAILGIVFSLGLTASDMYRLHPYQTVYYNRLLAGGLAKAAKNYETDYWGNSYREGILWVIQNYHPPTDRKIRVLNASWPFQTGYYLEQTPELQSRFEMVEDKPDIFLSTTRRGCEKAYAGNVLYTVERFGTPLLYVIEVPPEHSTPNKIQTC